MTEKDLLIQDMRRELQERNETIKRLIEDRGKWMALARMYKERIGDVKEETEPE